MAIFDRFNCGVVAAGAALCGVALVLSPVASAVTPLVTGGDACLYEQAGTVGAAGAMGPAARASRPDRLPQAHRRPASLRCPARSTRTAPGRH